MTDIVIGKINSIQRCISRAREEYSLANGNFLNDFTHQDAAILNILRACEQTIDLANHIIKINKFGIPVKSSESFYLLKAQSIITVKLADSMNNMVHFRNTVIHQYTRMNMGIVESVIKTNLDDMLDFTDSIITFVNK